MSKIGDIKDQIETELGKLEENGTIAGYHRLQFRQLTMDLADLGAYPFAVLTPPTLEDTEQLDNRNAERVARFSIDIVFKADNLTADNEVEDTIEAVMDHFDDESDDLSGFADGGVETASTSPRFSNGADRRFVLASVILKVHHTRQMTF